MYDVHKIDNGGDTMMTTDAMYYIITSQNNYKT